MCHFEQDVARCLGDFRHTTAHDTRQCHGLDTIADHRGASRQRARGAIKRHQGFAFPRRAHHDGCVGQCGQIERVHRLTEAMQHVVGRIDHVADAALPDTLETLHEPCGAWPNGHPANDNGQIGRAARCIVDAYAHAVGGCRVMPPCFGEGCRDVDEIGDRQRRCRHAGNGRDLTRDAAM